MKEFDIYTADSRYICCVIAENEDEALKKATEKLGRHQLSLIAEERRLPSAEKL